MGGLARPDGSWQPKVLDLRDEEETRNSPGKNYLTFPRTVVKEPVLSLMAKQIRRGFQYSRIGCHRGNGTSGVRIDGARTELDKAVAWLKEKGVTVEPIEKNAIE